MVRNVNLVLSKLKINYKLYPSLTTLLRRKVKPINNRNSTFPIRIIFVRKKTNDIRQENFQLLTYIYWFKKKHTQTRISGRHLPNKYYFR